MSRVASKKSSSKSNSKRMGGSDKKGGMSRDKTKSMVKGDPFAMSLSSRTGLDKFVHESAWEAPWNPMGAAGRST